jgi:hypothetical protein
MRPFGADPRHARVLEVVGPSKENGTKYPRLRNLKAVLLLQMLPDVEGWQNTEILSQ